MAAASNRLARLRIFSQLKERVRLLDRKTLIQGTIIGASSVAFLVFFFIPVWLQNHQFMRENEHLRTQSQAAGALIAQIPEMKRQKEAYGARISEIRSWFFEPQERDRLIAIVSATASETGVRISASSPSKEVIAIPDPFDQRYAVAGYDLAVEGSYHDLGTFVNRLENYPKHFTIDRLKITRTETGSDVLTCRFALRAFLKKSAGS